MTYTMEPGELSEVSLLAEIADVIDGRGIVGKLGLKAKSLGDTVLVTVVGEDGEPRSYTLDITPAEAVVQVELDRGVLVPTPDLSPVYPGDVSFHADACREINKLYERHADACAVCCQLSGEFCLTGLLLQRCIEYVESRGSDRQIDDKPTAGPDCPATASVDPRSAVDRIGDLFDELAANGQIGDLKFTDERDGDSLRLGIFDRALTAGISLHLPLIAS
jgi:hypothetical protein